MIKLEKNRILAVGLHRKIIQSILDFDYIKGDSEPSIVAIVSGGRKIEKFWFGNKEILIPIYANIESVPQNLDIDLLLNLASAGSAKNATQMFFEHFPKAWGAHIFCEGLPEQDALFLIEEYGKNKFIAGPSGVGLLFPGYFKLGAIGGVSDGIIKKLASNRGDTAIVCSSGGMANELIHGVVNAGGVPSFAVSYGGEYFPVSSLLDWCLFAEEHESTKRIVLFGELGGTDEYLLLDAIKNKKITKPVFAYIAGHFESNESAIQFGHAKALAKSEQEDAKSKLTALAEVGVNVFYSYAEFCSALKSLSFDLDALTSAQDLTLTETKPRQTLFTANKDKGTGQSSFIKHALCTLLERDSVSDALVSVTEMIFSELISHGAEPSGSVNTMITARAGKDMVSSISAGLLTVGNRFGGAVNGAALNWYRGVNEMVTVDQLLQEHKKLNEYVLGIGHKKYSINQKDPRVEIILNLIRSELKSHKYLDYALEVEKITVSKKSNLILNVDGVVAAAVLDILEEKENFSTEEIKELIDIGFFNSFFIIPRTVGFISDFLGQKRRDEGLFRLPGDEVYYI